MDTIFMNSENRPRVLELSFIVIRVHQKIKALLCRINFDY